MPEPREPTSGQRLPRGSLVFADENPGALLRRGGEAHLAVSLWRSAWSPVGGGHVLAFTPPEGPPLVLADSAELAGIVVPTFLRHWDLFADDVLDAVPVQDAAFAVHATSDSWSMSARTPTLELMARWAGLQAPTTHPVHGHDAVRWGGRPLLVDHHVSTATRVDVVFDGVDLHAGADLAAGYVTLAERWWTT